MNESWLDAKKDKYATFEMNNTIIGGIVLLVLRDWMNPWICKVAHWVVPTWTKTIIVGTVRAL